MDGGRRHLQQQMRRISKYNEQTIYPVMDCRGLMVKIKYFQRHIVFQHPQILLSRGSENWRVRATTGQREFQSE